MAFFRAKGGGGGGEKAGFRVMLKYFEILYKTNRFHVAVRLFRNRSQMTSKCGKNKIFCSYHILTSSVIYF